MNSQSYCVAHGRPDIGIDVEEGLVVRAAKYHGSIRPSSLILHNDPIGLFSDWLLGSLYHRFFISRGAFELMISLLDILPNTPVDVIGRSKLKVPCHVCSSEFLFAGGFTMSSTVSC